MQQTRLTGKITRYGTARYGFIESDGTPYFFTQRDLNPYVTPQEGMMVEFDVKEVVGKADHAVNVTVIK